MKGRKSCHHLSNLFNPLPCPTHYPIKHSKNTSLRAQAKHGALPLAAGLAPPCAYHSTTTAPGAGHSLPAWTQRWVWALTPRPMQRGLCKEPEEAAISQSSCDGWVREQVCSPSSQGQGSEMSLRGSAGVAQLPIAWWDPQAAYPHWTYATTQERWGVAVWEESQAAPRGCQGLWRQG